VGAHSWRKQDAQQPIEVRFIAGAIGADPQCRRPRGPTRARSATSARSLLDHYPLRDQKLDAVRHKAFTRRFGETISTLTIRARADPEIIVITREPGDKKIVGEDWHADTTMMPEPPMGAILYAIEVPPYGGDTLFANQYLAYETLSDGMKRMLSGMRALH
jgi:taurine dioxygenase